MTEPKKKRGKGQVMTPEALQRLAARKPPNKKEEVSELPTWSKLAIIKHELLGQSWADIAEEMGKGDANLHNLKSSPAAKKLIASLRELSSDPVAMAREVIRGAALGIAVENLLHYEAVKKAGDFGEAGRQLRFLTETVGVSMPKNAEQAPTQIVINLGGGISLSAEIPMGESESTKVLPAEIITDE